MALAHNTSIVTSGLVLYLDAANPKSYPGSGTTWTDLSGLGNNGTLTNGPTFNGSNGGSIVLDGVDDVISAPSYSFSSNSSYTYEIWVNPDDAGSVDGLIGGVNNPAIRYGQPTNKFRLFLGWSESPGYQQLDSDTISPQQWYHVVGTVNASDKTFALFTNVTDVKTGTWSIGTITVPPSTIYFNQRDSARSFNGKIAIEKIYNRALTAAEVAQNFEALRDRYGL